MDGVEVVYERFLPVADAVVFAPLQLAVVAAAAIVAVSVRPIWAVVKLGVTLVHELGHAMVGILVGRKFNGFVLRSDMSGYAVMTGKPRGVGRVLSTWAGYPAPACTAAALTWAAASGWAAAMIAALTILLAISIPRVRSLLTFAVLMVVLTGAASLWWWRSDALQSHVLVGLSIVLLVGAWRHVGSVFRSKDSGSDPAVLAKLTLVPAWLWNVSFVVVIGACSWWVGSLVWRSF